MRHRQAVFVWALVVLCGVVTVAGAADWPMWRADTARSGAVPGKLPARLSVAWTRELPERRVAWPNEPRLQFDVSYEPIIAGSFLLLTSSVDGSLTAYDTRSGKERWRVDSDGPVRLAPAVWHDRVYFGSDDGYLYCVDWSTGKMQWRVRGAPADRPDCRQLGNHRIVSYWPVRSGPVVDQGLVYFAAGIWPTMGIYVHAVDAQSGKIRWSNRHVDYLPGVRIDHNTFDDVGLSPQGYNLIVDHKLVVPNGRSMPARFDLKTGKLLYYVQGYRNGDSRVTAGGDYLFVGHRGVVSLADGREVGNRWVEAAKKAPKEWDWAKRDLFEGPFWGYKFMRGCDYRSVFDGKLVLGVEQGILYSYDLSRPRKTTYEVKAGSVTAHPARWELESVWKPVRIAAPPRRIRSTATNVSIKVGSRLYTHVGRELIAVDIPPMPSETEDAKQPGSGPRVAWRMQLDGVPTSMSAGDDRLFVVLDGRRLVCLADVANRPVHHPLPHEPLRRSGIAAAQAVLKQSGNGPGFAVVFDLDKGDLVDGLLRKSAWRVVVVDDDAELVRRLRRHWMACGVYGRRVEAVVGTLHTVRLAPYLAGLVVRERPADDLDAAARAELAEEVRRLLHPYGGRAVLPWTTLAREGGLKGAADWTHESGDAARRYYSADRLVEAPLAILWYGDGPDHGFQKYKDYGRGVKPQVAHGRLFAFDDRAQQLTALDIYTGRLLWRRDMPTSIVRFASFADGVYVATGKGCERLDPATGKPLQRYQWHLPEGLGKVPGAVAVRVSGSLLLIGIGFDVPQGHSHPAIESGLWDAKVLVALDRETGATRWTRVAEQRFNLHAIAVGKDAVYCVDSMAPLQADKLVRRGKAPDKFRSVLYALDARTGELRWTRSYDYRHRPMTGRGPLAIRPYDDWVAYHAESDTVLVGKLHAVHALDAATGASRWSSPHAGMQPLILRPDSFINQAGHQYDLATGKRLSQQPLFHRTGGCNYTVGSENLLFLRAKCATYVDLRTTTEHSLRNLRSGCSNSLVAAGGLLNVPCFSTGCVCNYPLQTSFAMYHLLEVADWSTPAAAARQ